MPTPRDRAIRYRVFPPKEVRQLAALFEHTFWAKGRSLADLRKMLKHSGPCLSAWDGPRLVGFARVLTDFVYRAALYDVVVAPEYRGRGVGLELLRRLHAHPKLRRVSVWYLSTRDAHGLYEKLGWQRNPTDFMKFRLPVQAKEKC